MISEYIKQGICTLLLLAKSVFSPEANISPETLKIKETGLYCAIDMGSSSFKVIIGEIKQGKYLQRSIKKERLHLGDEVEASGRISESKLKEIEATLKQFISICDDLGIKQRKAVATSAVRDAKNQNAVIEIAKRLNLELEVATEKRESLLAYYVGTLGEPNLAVVDNGSRSVELASQKAGVVNGEGFNWAVFNLGYRIAFKKYFENAKTFKSGRAQFLDVLESELIKRDSFMRGMLGAVAVEMEGVAQFILDKEDVEGRVLAIKQISKKVDELLELNEEKYQKLLKQKNMDQILPRLVVMESFLRNFGYSEIKIVDRELGVGLIVERGLEN